MFTTTTVFIFYFAASQWCLADDSFLTRRLSTGLILGKHLNDSDNYVYLGIPYAAPPVGSLRYRKPNPKPKWNDTVLATNFKPSCSQNYLRINETSTLEDCLYLNVFTTKICLERSNCSVAVVIPDYSQSSDEIFGFLEKDVVTVSISYRVGSFGFLNVNPAQNVSQDKNVALLDILASLQWVQKEIAVFGGSPQRITVLSSNDGAVLVDLLSLSPASQGLFDRMVLLSGSAGFRAVSQNSSCYGSRRMSVRAKCAENYTKFDGGKETDIILTCLRSRDVRYLLNIESKLLKQHIAIYFPMLGPAQELFPDTIRNLTKRRRKLDVLLINNKYERLTDETLVSRGWPNLEKLNAICEYFIGNDTAAINKCNTLYDSANIVNIYNDYRIFAGTVDNAVSVTNTNGSAFIVEIADQYSLADAFNNSNSFGSRLRGLLFSFLTDGIPSYGGRPLTSFSESKFNFAAIKNGKMTEKSNFRRTEAEFWNEIKLRFPMERRISCHSISHEIIETVKTTERLQYTGDEVDARKDKDDPKEADAFELIVYSIGIIVAVIAAIAIVWTCVRLFTDAVTFSRYHRID